MNVKQFNIIPPKVLFDFALKASVRGFNENESCMVESSERLDSLYLKIRFLGKPQTGRCNKSKQKRKKARGEIFFFCANCGTRVTSFGCSPWPHITV